MVNLTDDDIAAALLNLAALRGADKTFCPSEVARGLTKDWRPLMPRVRHVAAGLPLVATQRGVRVDPVQARGPIRLAQDPG